MKKIEKKIINKYINDNDKLIFVGMTADIPTPTHKFFIKITNFSDVYKRLLLRELEKIVLHHKKIKKHIIEENNPKEIDIQRIADMSLVFPVSYDDFLEDYKERLNGAITKKYLPKIQKQIINTINKIIN